MTIEKTYKLTIKDVYYYLDEKELNALYEQCRMALNVKDLPTTNPVKPNIPYPYDTYPWYTPKYPNDTGTPYWTGPTTTCGTINAGSPTTTCGTINAGSPTTTCGTIKAGEGICVMDTNWQTNLCNTVKSSTDINFISDDMAVHEDNQKWRSSVEQALDKLKENKK
jgi:hypothetical protein